MAIFTQDYNGWKVQTGDPSIDGDMKEQLNVTLAELCSAINMENVSDKLFSRVLKNRSLAHQALLAKIPGA